MTRQKPFINEIASIYTKTKEATRLIAEQTDFDEYEMLKLLVEALTEAGITAQINKVPEGHVLQLVHPKSGTTVDLKIDLIYPF